VSVVTKTHVAIEADAIKRLDLIVRDMTELPREQVKGLFDHFCVKVNGTISSRPADHLQAGDEVEVKYDLHQRYHVKRKPPKEIGFEVVFEDEHLIVVNKPAALLTVPTPYRERNTLIDKVTAYLRTADKRGEAFVCHRLDRGVSGLLLFGKSLEISMQIRDQFELRKPQREYIALVRGVLTSHEGIFRSYLATDGNLNRFSTQDKEAGQLAITHFRTVTTLDDATLVQIWLETGRRNQIRVHFAEKGHPVLGDPRYQSRLAEHPRWKARRIALHARSLGFTHPVTGQAYRFESELPQEFVEFITGGKKMAGRQPRR
jgi:23S rRNA pseudouridine1911/1915/1917 synthase